MNRPGRTLWHDDQGAAIAEFAMVLPVIVVLAGLLLYWGRASVVSIGCQDAAANVARTLVAQEQTGDLHMAAQTVAGANVGVEVNDLGSSIEVTTKCAVVADPWGIVPRTVTGHAVGVKQEQP